MKISSIIWKMKTTSDGPDLTSAANAPLDHSNIAATAASPGHNARVVIVLDGTFLPPLLPDFANARKRNFAASAANLIYRRVRRAAQQKLKGNVVPLAGLEPARIATPDFESGASTNSATGAWGAIIPAKPCRSTRQGVSRALCRRGVSKGFETDE